MKYKTLYWILGILVGLAVIVGLLVAYEILHPLSPVATQPGTSTTTSNVGNTTGSSNTSPLGGSTMRVPIQTGGTLKTKDFIHNRETVEDAVNPGLYYLAGSLGYCLGNGTCPSGYNASDFTVTYDSATGNFNVVLAKEPISKARTDAEQFLESRLGVKDFILCSLFYFVSVPSSIDSQYAGSNLGFSFCPGAVVLP